jgi:hypothetical protein
VTPERAARLFYRSVWALIVSAWFIVVAISDCGCSDDAQPFGVDGGAGGAGGKAVDGAAGATDAGTTDAIACAGCWAGGTCVPRASETEDLCGIDGQPCGRTRLDCGGTVAWACPEGQAPALRHACAEPVGQTITRPVCCPVNVCTYEACR